MVDSTSKNPFNNISLQHIQLNLNNAFQGIKQTVTNDISGLYDASVKNSFTRGLAWRAAGVGLSMGLGVIPTGNVALSALKSQAAFHAAYYAVGKITEKIDTHIPKASDSFDKNDTSFKHTLAKAFDNAVALTTETIPAAILATGINHALNGQASLSGAISEIKGEFEFNSKLEFGNAIASALGQANTVSGAVLASLVGGGLNMIDIKPPFNIKETKSNLTTLINNTISRSAAKAKNITLPTIKFSGNKADNIANLVISPMLATAALAGLSMAPMTTTAIGLGAIGLGLGLAAFKKPQSNNNDDTSIKSDTSKDTQYFSINNSDNSENNLHKLPEYIE